MSEPRHFAQIHCTGPGHYVAVADDGTAWEFRRRDYAWMRLPSLPDRIDSRPKPPSLAEDALEALVVFGGYDEQVENTIRAALERLKELESQ